MIERHVYFKLKNQYASEAGRAELVAESKRVIPSVPGVVGMSVAIPSDDASLAAWDVALTVRFDSMDAVQPYIVHPDHRRYVDEFLAPRVEVKKAWNFEIA